MTMEGFQKLVRKLDLMDKVSKLHHEHGHDHNHGHNDTDELVAHRHEQTNQPAEQDNKTVSAPQLFILQPFARHLILCIKIEMRVER